MSALHHAIPTLELRAAPSGIITGYASVFGGVDSYGDTVAQGAFSDSLKRNKPLMLWQHQTESPVGHWDNLQEDTRGLHVSGQLNLQTNLGRETYAHLQAGDLNGLSIGYNLAKGDAVRQGEVLLIKRVDLAEISIVSLPADSNARITSVKSQLLKPATMREFEKSLQEIGFSRREASSIAARGFAQADDESDEIQDALVRIKTASKLFNF